MLNQVIVRTMSTTTHLNRWACKALVDYPKPDEKYIFSSGYVRLVKTPSECCSSSWLCRLSLNSLRVAKDSVTNIKSQLNIGDEQLTPKKETYRMFKIIYGVSIKNVKNH